MYFWPVYFIFCSIWPKKTPCCIKSEILYTCLSSAAKKALNQRSIKTVSTVCGNQTTIKKKSSGRDQSGMRMKSQRSAFINFLSLLDFLALQRCLAHGHPKKKKLFEGLVLLDPFLRCRENVCDFIDSLGDMVQFQNWTKTRNENQRWFHKMLRSSGQLETRSSSETVPDTELRSNILKNHFNFWALFYYC